MPKPVVWILLIGLLLPAPQAQAGCPSRLRLFTAAASVLLVAGSLFGVAQWTSSRPHDDLSTVADPAYADSPAFQKLVLEQGASSPFTSHLKTNPYSVPPSTVQDLLEGRDFDAGIGGVTIDRAAVAYSVELDLKKGDRDDRLRENIRSLVDGQEEGELLIVFAGGSHMLDYFLLTRDTRPLYLSYQVGEHSMLVPKPLDAFIRMVKSEAPLRGPASQYVNSFTMGPLTVLQRRSTEGPIPFDVLYSVKSKPDPRQRVRPLLISDIHRLDAHDLANLPPASYWKKRGVRKVTVAMEGMKFGKDYTQADVDGFQVHDFSADLEMMRKLVELAKQKPERLDEKHRLHVERTKVILEGAPDGKIYELPEMEELKAKAREYKILFPVRYTGIE